MPTLLCRLDLTRHRDPMLQLARARPDRVQLVAWAIRYHAHHTDGLDVARTHGAQVTARGRHL